MNKDNLTRVLSQVATGSLSVDAAQDQLKHLEIENIDFAQIDHHRSLRKGFPEVIFGQGKTSAQIIGIMEKMICNENIVLVTLLEPDKAKTIRSVFPAAEYFEDARLLWLKKKEPDHRPGKNSGHLCRDLGYSGCTRGVINGPGHGK